MITYAQNFEDVMLERLFPRRAEGFYVDIGAWDPTLHSVTRHFYDAGWRGINVEPIRRLHERFVAERPRDVNLHAAVGDRAGTLPFFEVEDVTSLSTADPAHAAELRARGRPVREYAVEVITLAQVAGHVGAREVDFLKIDVEGLEAAVLRGADWSRMRPRALVIEATRPDTPIEDWDRADDVAAWSAWEPLVLAAGYRFAYYDGLSRFYLREEDAALAARLRLPPGVHDRIDSPESSAEAAALRETLAQVAADRDAIAADRDEKARVVERAVAEAAAVAADRAAKAEVIDRVLADAAAVAQDRDAKAQVIEALASKAAALDDARQRLEESRQRLEESAERLEEHRQHRSALDLVARAGADRELLRKAAAGGVLDVVWRRRWMRLPRPAYAFHHHPAATGTGLHVAIDALEIVFGVSGGVETYMDMLVRSLLAGHHSVSIACLPDQLPVLRQRFQDRVGYIVARGSRAMEAAISASRRVGRHDRLLAGTSLLTFARLAEDFGVDLLHSPVQIFALTDFTTPAVLNLHDLQHLHFPENFRPSDIEARNHHYGLSAGLAGAIVVSSGFVRDDVTQRMGIPPGKVFTVPVTWNPQLEEGLAAFGADEARRHYGLPARFALYPAQFWPHKNHATLVQALAIVKERRPAAGFKLVFTGFRGLPGWKPTEALIARLGLSGDVLCLDHVPFGHLAGLYRASEFCVMPSTFEASSYPVIEAQVVGVAAMCSNVTSLPELVKDGAGLLFEPLDAGDIAAKMLRWIDDPADRAAHAARGMARARHENSPRAYLEGLAAAYDHAIGSRR